MNILYAGDSYVGGPANYLLGILRFLKASFVHVPPGKKLEPSVLRKRFDAVILSDFPHKNLPRASEKLLVGQVQSGAGLLMVGGWASFSGPYGKWRGSAVEKLLPVRCLSRDDRRNEFSGLTVLKGKNHVLLKGLSFDPPPVICGLNEARVKETGEVILTAQAIAGFEKFPLLVIEKNSVRRIAALMTDCAPHWCGGLVDWGKRRRILSVSRHIHIEIGESYVRFLSSLIKWAADQNKSRS
ncbi:MAG: hypothetical protein HY587_05095 [Candidatus Omnitrophica bacterium]|nr:hypothetical protein [Candidatus Omnitrophota bacterium]